MRALNEPIARQANKEDCLNQTPTLVGSFCKRAQTVDINYRLPSRGAATHLVVDATGLKVFGEGEWKQRKHCKSQRRIGCKLHPLPEL